MLLACLASVQISTVGMKGQKQPLSPRFMSKSYVLRGIFETVKYKSTTNRQASKKPIFLAPPQKKLQLGHVYL